jgi:signal transduction histidine kinase
MATPQATPGDTADPMSVRAVRGTLGLSALLLTAFALAFSWLSWHAESERQMTYLASVAELTEKSLDGYFQGLEKALSGIQDDLGRNNGNGDIDPVTAEIALLRFKATYPDMRIIILARADGQIIATTETNARRPLPSLGHEPSFIISRQELTKGQTLSIGRAFKGSVSGDWIIPVRFGLRDGDGKLTHTLGGGLPLAKPQSFWKDAPLPAGAALGLVRDDGYIISRYPLPARGKLEDLYGKPILGGGFSYMVENNFPRSGSTVRRSTVTGEEAQFVFRRLAHYPLYVYLNNPVANIWTAWWQSARYTYLLLALLVLGGLLIYRWSQRQQARWDAERDRRISELEAANRELDAFTYTVSHDLRAPVRAIDGYAAMLGEDFSATLPEPGRRRIEQIRASARRMGYLIDGLLSFARFARQALSRQSLSTEALVQSVVAELAPAGVPAIRVGALPPSDADPVLLRQVWVNLLSNAVKYSRNAQPPLIEVGYADGAYFVRDNGIGFDMAHTKNLFGAFSRLHGADAFDGSGVGLAIVKRIVERHGGSIEARAEPGKGATFSFTLGPGPA